MTPAVFGTPAVFNMSSLDRAIAQIDEIFDALQQKLKQAAAQKPSPSAPSAPAAVPARADPVAEAAAAAPKQQKKKEKKEKPAKPPQAVEDPIQKANLRVSVHRGYRPAMHLTSKGVDGNRFVLSAGGQGGVRRGS